MTLAPDGLLVVDKPSGWTSHDVVARGRRLAATRKVGHAGTLDPMATGVLLLGIGRATRLLGHLALAGKAYDATIRLGEKTITDDAEGDVVEIVDASQTTDEAIRAACARYVGAIEQVPSAVSAIKIKGERAYKRARAGETVELAARPVTIHRLDVRAIRRSAAVVDVDVHVDCSTGTYIRALARDLGAALGTGGHLTALRRTRVGPYGLAGPGGARTLDALRAELTVLPLADAAAAAFPRWDVDERQARLIGNGVRIAATGLPDGPVAVFGPQGDLVALIDAAGDARAKSLAVFAAPAASPS